MMDNDKSYREPELLRKQKLREYWTRKFDGDFAMGELPPDRAATAKSSGGQETLTSVFSDALSRRVLAATRGSLHGLFVLLAAGVHALLHRYSSVADFVTAFPPPCDQVTGTRASGLLALRTHITSGMTFRALLEQTRADVTEAQRYGTVRRRRSRVRSRTPRASGARSARSSCSMRCMAKFRSPPVRRPPPSGSGCATGSSSM